MRSVVNIFCAISLSGLSLLSMPVMAENSEDMQALVDELDTLTTKARKERAADRWLQNALEDLVEKYNYPWRNLLLSDDFSDGDYTQEPVWILESGDFWIDRRLGLRSQVVAQTRPEPRTQEKRQDDRDIGKALLGALLQEALGPAEKQDSAQDRREPVSSRAKAAAIMTAVNIPTTFAIETGFSQNNRPGESGHFEWHVMQDRDGQNAYKLVVLTGEKASIELVKTRSGRDYLIESAQLEDLNQSGEQMLSWRQTAEGQIEIFLNDLSVMKVRERMFRHGFKYLGMSNRQGDFSVSSIQVLGGS